MKGDKILKLGISLRPPHSGIIKEYLKEMTPHGELSNVSHFEVNYPSSQMGYSWRNEYVTEVGNLIRSSGVTSSVHYPSFNSSEPHLLIRNIIIQEFRETVAYASQIGAKHIVVHPGYLDYYETPKILTEPFIHRMEGDLAKATERAVPILQEFARIAEQENQVVLLENMPLPRAISKNCQEMKHIQSAVNRPNVKFVLDTGHLHLTDGDLYETILCLGNDLLQIHVHDNDAVYDQHRIPGMGSVDWVGFARGLKEICFDGVLVMELADLSYKSMLKATQFLETLDSE